MTEWRDLSEEDKIKVIGGTVMAVTMSITLFVFTQFFLVEDRLHISSLLASGASSFSIMRIILPIIYLVLVLPAALAAGATVFCFRRRFSEISNSQVILGGVLLGILMGGGAYLLIVTLFLTLFDVLLSGLPIEVAIILVALALFVPAVIIAQIMRAKQNSKYLKWAFK
jgi:hypothetical protein